MNCWHCGTEVIWGGDHDMEEEEEDYCMSTNLSCPKCGSFYMVYLPKDKEENNFFIEVKGLFTSSDRGKHLLLKKQHPDLDLRFLFMNANNKLYKGSKTTYGGWCDRHDYKWCQGFVPKEWLK